jgi:pantoate--beta-alanine ligase
MQIIKEKAALQAVISTYKNTGASIGFVPTMGALHCGHISLVKYAAASCDLVVVSIFVNPTQFNNSSDLTNYPRTLNSDLDLLQQLDLDLLIFTPNASELYGEKIEAEHFHFDGLEHEMEGKFRAGHFDGVGTVVKRFFEIVKPDKAFFGEKDYQQLQIIRKLTQKEGLPVQVIGCAVDRESSGLARSSRNERLSEAERNAASFIYQTLLKAKHKFGTESAKTIEDWVKKEFESHPFLKLEYFEIADANSLKKAFEKSAEGKYRAFIAAYAGEVRLIDNVALNY